MKIESTAAVAVNVTVVPVLYVSVQSVPQLIPAGLDDTTPLPTPARVTVKPYTRVKLAVMA